LVRAAIEKGPGSGKGRRQDGGGESGKKTGDGTKPKRRVYGKGRLAMGGGEAQTLSGPNPDVFPSKFLQQNREE